MGAGCGAWGAECGALPTLSAGPRGPLLPQMDEDNEALSGAGELLPGHRFAAAAPLERVLRARGLWDNRIEAELEAVRAGAAG
jgi:hypothetical protein